MTSKPPFNYSRFVGQYRAACAKRGIDPARGATGYQVVHVNAERRRQARQTDRWWQRHDLWLNCPPYHSETEQEAVWNLFTQAYALLAIRLARAARLRREIRLSDRRRRWVSGER